MQKENNHITNNHLISRKYKTYILDLKIINIQTLSRPLIYIRFGIFCPSDPILQ